MYIYVNLYICKGGWRENDRQAVLGQGPRDQYVCWGNVDLMVGLGAASTWRIVIGQQLSFRQRPLPHTLS